MSYLMRGLYCGIVIGNIYYMSELCWNWFNDKLIVDLKPMLSSYSLYIGVFCFLGIVVSVGLGFLHRGKNETEDGCLQCAWISTAVAMSFFGSLFLVSGIFFYSSDVFRGAVIICFSVLVMCICLLIYSLINRFVGNVSARFKPAHLFSLLALNVFIILSIKINMNLKTVPWSFSNLFWDLIAILGSMLISGFCLMLFYVIRPGSGRFTALKKIIVICTGSALIWGLYSGDLSGKNIEQSSGEFFKSENISCPFILITLDTLRADHLGSYGYMRETSPNIDRFSKDGVRFQNVISPIPLTRPSHFSMLTGRYPPSHGLVDNLGKTPEHVPLLSETLIKEGYDTAAFVSAAILSSSFNTKFGFQEYYDEIMNIFFDHNFLLISNLRYLDIIGIKGIKSQNSAAETNQRLFKWLEQKRKRPLFLWTHYFDPHRPYDPEDKYKALFTNKTFEIQKYWNYEFEKENYDPVLKKMSFSSEIIQYAIDLYDAEIREMDAEIGALFNKLKELNIYNKALIIMTSDHGESFEHGYYFDHGDRLYDGLIRVPLIIKFPGNSWKGRTINTQVEIIDIAPTVLEFLSFDPLEGMDGRSLMPLIISYNNDGLRRKKYAYSQTPYRHKFFFKAEELQSVRTNEWKYIYNSKSNKYELYNLIQDSQEENDISSENLVILKEYQSVLSEFNKSYNEHIMQSEKADMDRNTIEKIKSLGYIN